MKVNRLLEITTLLLQGKTIPAKEFAERFHVSTRTIYRDVEDLSLAGIPVYMRKGKGGGISLLDTFTLDRTLVSEQESDSLLLALKTLQAARYPEVDQILARFEAVFKNAAPRDWVLIEFSPWGSGPNEENRFVEIKHAILQQKMICFDYIDAHGAKSQRQVEPVQLIFKSSAWYLRGFCTDRQDFRTFRLSRIRNLVVSSQGFQRRAEPEGEQEPARERPRNLVSFKMQFTREVLQRVYDDFPEGCIEQLEDGSCRVTLDLVEDEWVYGMILSYGCFVEVLEPAHVRGILRERMEKAARQYRII